MSSYCYPIPDEMPLAPALKTPSYASALEKRVVELELEMERAKMRIRELECDLAVYVALKRKVIEDMAMEEGLSGSASE